MTWKPRSSSAGRRRSQRPGRRSRPKSTPGRSPVGRGGRQGGQGRQGRHECSVREAEGKWAWHAWARGSGQEGCAGGGQSGGGLRSMGSRGAAVGSGGSLSQRRGGWGVQCGLGRLGPWGPPPAAACLEADGERQEESGVGEVQQQYHQCPQGVARAAAADDGQAQDGARRVGAPARQRRVGGGGGCSWHSWHGGVQAIRARSGCCKMAIGTVRRGLLGSKQAARGF